MRRQQLSGFLGRSLLIPGLVSTTIAGGNSAAGDDGCDCFLTNGSHPAYYSNHLFFDFRNLSQYQGVPDVITKGEDSTSAPPSSDYFKSDNWTSIWALQTWNNSIGDGKGLSGDATVEMVNSANNIFIQENNDTDARSDTYLAMRTIRLQDFQSAAEFQATSSDYQFLSLRMLARTVGDAGAVAAMFTYRSADKLIDIQEADLEILTRDPTDQVQYTNQPSYTEGGDQGDDPRATRNSTMPYGLKYTDWAVHRLDWTPKTSVWYVDGQEVANIEFQVPRDPAGINFNSWSDGGSWSGNMSVGGEASLQIQWIEMVYNTTDHDNKKRGSGSAIAGRILPRRSSGHCGTVCSIDETNQTGIATVLSNGESSDAAGRLTCLWSWIVLGISAAFFFV